MSSSTPEPDRSDEISDGPRLPPRSGDLPQLPGTDPRERADWRSAGSSPPAEPDLAVATPYLPPVERPAPEPAPEPVFDAKAMVESQKHFNPDPAYGALPTGTAESREAAKQLRAEANRKRRRNRNIARVAGVVVLGLVVVAGVLAFRAFDDDQDSVSDSVTPETDQSSFMTAVRDARAHVDALATPNG